MADHNGPVRNERKRARFQPWDAAKPVPETQKQARKEFGLLLTARTRTNKALIKAEMTVIDKQDVLNKINQRIRVLEQKHGASVVPPSQRRRSSARGPMHGSPRPSGEPPRRPPSPSDDHPEREYEGVMDVGVLESYLESYFAAHPAPFNSPRHIPISPRLPRGVPASLLDEFKKQTVHFLGDKAAEAAAGEYQRSYSPTSPRYVAVPFFNGPEPAEAWHYGSHGDKSGQQSEVPVIDLYSDGEDEDFDKGAKHNSYGSRPRPRRLSRTRSSSGRRNSNSNSNSNSNAGAGSTKDVAVSECPVCFESLLAQNTGVFPTCERHEFCFSCLQQLDIDKGCPVCRAVAK